MIVKVREMKVGKERILMPVDIVLIILHNRFLFNIPVRRGNMQKIMDIVFAN
jgi:hypothetical protein